MPQIIANTYELLHEIGAGGGGVVYLGRHLRLEKLVVLKADKRPSHTKIEKLRREVDALKELSHTYIPQVYDFFIEDGVTYTVIDYIDGESLDKPLKRGEQFAQADVVTWAIQLLEAVEYLHSRPPHGILHSDIKPANIILTKAGHICLIDFNIALALGDSGAVRVGFSRGYASPEHYGIDYRLQSQQHTGATTQMGEDTAITQVSSGVGSTSASHPVFLDVRSDIYSIGATLYHLFTGKRPAQDAFEVVPIGRNEVNPAIAAILQKAMAPNPDDRYATASEMLYDFRHLREKDSRTVQRKRRIRTTAISLCAVFLLGGVMTMTGLKQMERLQSAYALAEYSADALRQGDVKEALSLALEALPEKEGFFSVPHTAQAQAALTEALGVYDLSDGFKSLHTVPMESAPIKLASTPSGSSVAALCNGTIVVIDTATGKTYATLQAAPSALADIAFTDESTLLFAGRNALESYDLNSQKTLWQSEEPATAIAVSADGSTAAAVYKDNAYAIIYDAKSGNVTELVDFKGKHQSITANDVFADPQDNLFALDSKGRYLAVSFSDGSLEVYDLLGDNDLVWQMNEDYTHFEGGFFGTYLAFSALNSKECVFTVIDTETQSQTGGFTTTAACHVQADESGVYVSSEDVLVRLDPITGEQTEVAYSSGSDIVSFYCGKSYVMTTDGAGIIRFYDHYANLLQTTDSEECWNFATLSDEYAVLANRDQHLLRVMQRNTYDEAEVFTYDATYIHNEARYDPDSNTVMLYRYDSFRLYDIASGELLVHQELPDSDQIYDQQYRRTEQDCYLEVIYNDGTTAFYSAKDGALLSQQLGDVPDRTLYEEFITEHYRVTSPLHGTPELYEKDTDVRIGELLSEDYLTYITEVDKYLIAEYISSDGQRYGLLMDDNAHTLAHLPNLCDILPDGTLLFDDMAGHLRQSRIYTLDELRNLAKTTLLV